MKPSSLRKYVLAGLTRLGEQWANRFAVMNACVFPEWELTYGDGPIDHLDVAHRSVQAVLSALCKEGLVRHRVEAIERFGYVQYEDQYQLVSALDRLAAL